jgi:prepilin-type N-terminal cleavage/methylation domain-containing protein
MRINSNRKCSAPGRGGFTLMELVVAVSLSSMVMMALATIHSTVINNVYSSFAKTKAASDLSLTSKLLRNKLLTSTRIDIPAFGAGSNILAFASTLSSRAFRRNGIIYASTARTCITIAHP